VWDGEGNLVDIDPLFMDPENEDFRLQLTSPCIDAGTADLDGNGFDDNDLFYTGSAPDMGAHEWVIAAPNLQAYSLDSTIFLTWSAIEEDLLYYQLDRATNAMFTENVDQTYVTTNTYTDDDIDTGIEYFYRVSGYVGYWTDYSNTVSVIIESLDLDEDSAMDLDYKIHQNYPNPFNPTTEIKYDLPEDALVSINIYDLMGRSIKSLVNSQQTAGYRSTQWNATNNLGEPVSAGMYLYTIQAGDFRQTKKMVLLK
jgi:hypothetical protein